MTEVDRKVITAPADVAVTPTAARALSPFTAAVRPAAIEVRVSVPRTV
ncbi:MAG: hypothetical protein J0M35_21050 [Candidatus Obscuribacter phosphatis]|uniref:Uncharacterized protein n=1 Tax=Candidatus Obscuribacter phosphatis TaxID=1906157 RepID=A0A8J7PLR2_9BACT|nr:hypothetical protein [Candidatus Obscuribacter phosphatis]